VPGPIPEASLLGTQLGEHKAAHVFGIEAVTPDAFAITFQAVPEQPDERDAMAGHAFALVTGGGCIAAAVRMVLKVAAHAGGTGMTDDAYTERKLRGSAAGGVSQVR
jgi:hypothetical protein